MLHINVAETFRFPPLTVSSVFVVILIEKYAGVMETHVQKDHFYPAFCFQQESSGAEPGPEKCHAEFISASLSGSPISESIYINPESGSGSETLKRVQGDNIGFPLQSTSDNNEKTSI